MGLRPTEEDEKNVKQGGSLGLEGHGFTGC